MLPYCLRAGCSLVEQRMMNLCDEWFESTPGPPNYRTLCEEALSELCISLSMIVGEGA